jgi:alpha-1,3-rhamnosyl/mannosyltransferase
VPSEQTKTALLRELPQLAGRIRVFAQPIDPQFLSAKGRERPRRERRGIVFVGVPRRRKNLPRLLDAWSRLPGSLREGHELHLVGPSSLEKLLRNKKPEQTRLVRVHKDLSTQALIELLDRSLGLALLSLSEGFGIPAFEAAARGIPCLCSEKSPMTEWLGDLPLVVDPYDTTSVEEGLRRLLEDSRLWDQASREGPVRAQEFAPKRSAEALLSLLQEAASL